jgi:RsiW-degrading membrane proteinase PrsW (M82 family)
MPSLVWLFFYLKEDSHPEPRYWLFIIFAMGVALAPIVIFLEMALTNFLSKYAGIGGPSSGLLIFLIAPFVEEIAKYGAVHMTLNKNPVLDEPVDGMIYIIVAALGFAAIENVFAIFSYIPVGAPGYLTAAFNFMSMRFISAVALHGLSSGIVGYFFSLYYFTKRDPRLIIFGLASAVSLHGLYNFLIVRTGEGSPLSTTLIGILLGGMAALVVYLFNRLKHYKIYQQAWIDEAAEYKI